METNLLCTISDKDQYSIIRNIQHYYHIFNRKIFILSIENNENDLIYTYNITNPIQEDLFLDNTFLIHRKKQTNTLYTINAVNVMAQKEGIDPLSYKVDWETYKNCLLICRDYIITVLKTKLYDIVEL